MSNKLIRSAFETRLKVWADSQGIAISFQNAQFNEPTGLYLRAFLLPASTLSDTLDRLHRHYRGIFQVSICAPISAGPGPSETVLASLETLFPPSANLIVGPLRIVVLQPASAGTAQQEPDRYVTPVSIQYRADLVPS